MKLLKDIIYGVSILEIKGNIPKIGEILKYKHYAFTIESVDKTRVKRIKVTINE